MRLVWALFLDKGTSSLCEQRVFDWKLVSPNEERVFGKGLGGEAQRWTWLLQDHGPWSLYVGVSAWLWGSCPYFRIQITRGTLQTYKSQIDAKFWIQTELGCLAAPRNLFLQGLKGWPCARLWTGEIRHLFVECVCRIVSSFIFCILRFATLIFRWPFWNHQACSCGISPTEASAVSHLSDNDTHFHFYVGSVTCPAKPNADFKPGEKYPLLVFSHGLGAFR